MSTTPRPQTRATSAGGRWRRGSAVAAAAAVAAIAALTGAPALAQPSQSAPTVRDNVRLIEQVNSEVGGSCDDVTCRLTGSSVVVTAATAQYVVITETTEAPTGRDFTLTPKAGPQVVLDSSLDGVPDMVSAAPIGSMEMGRAYTAPLYSSRTGKLVDTGVLVEWVRRPYAYEARIDWFAAGLSAFRWSIWLRTGASKAAFAPPTWGDVVDLATLPAAVATDWGALAAGKQTLRQGSTVTTATCRPSVEPRKLYVWTGGAWKYVTRGRLLDSGGTCGLGNVYQWSVTYTGQWDRRTQTRRLLIKEVGKAFTRKTWVVLVPQQSR